MACLVFGGKSFARAALRFEHPFGRSRVVQQLGRWAHWATYQFATAVGADALQMVVGALGAKGAFKGADACIERRRRQVAVAAFTVGAQLEHGGVVQSFRGWTDKYPL